MRVAKPLNEIGSPRIRFSNFFSHNFLMFLGPKMDSNRLRP
jgi:hypothetical protein